jgi:hypothetical protein
MPKKDKNNILDTNKLAADLKEKYPNAGIRSVEIDENTGRSTFMLEPNKRNLAILDKPGMAIKPRVYSESAATISRDFMSRQNLDLSTGKSPYEEEAKELFKKADEYYYTVPLLGSVTNVLASLAMKGFENDIDDDNIKNFYDSWAFDVDFNQVLEWIFLDFFKIGHVTTYKVLAKYEPRVSHLSPAPGQKSPTNKKSASYKKEVARIKKLHEEYEKEFNKEDAAKKNIWSKGHLPVAYTVLNPQLVEISGNLLFDNVSVKLKPPQELGELLKKPGSGLTEEEKLLIKSLPPGLKKAAESGGDFQLDSRLVSMITYRKQPYERYAKPRSTRVFETINYKKQLKNADISTLDGISNYILKVTVGNDEYPVVNQSELETVAKLFDTPSKAFDVVWNHTLEIEKIVSPEIEAILGHEKYKQVNEDMSAGLSVTRALIDGGGNVAQAEIALLTKGIVEEINYARRQVERWIYNEYRQLAEAAGFDRFPRVRWDEGVLKDTILYMNTLASLVDRRMLSYRTALEALGFDYQNELKNMQTELPMVTDGIFGIVGSPFQKSKEIQPTQKAPSGTPSSGRPSGQTKTKETNTDPANQPGTKTTKPKKTASVNVGELSDKEYLAFLSGARETLTKEEFYTFFDEMEAIRLGS